jgi:hypothetical protein
MSDPLKTGPDGPDQESERDDAVEDLEVSATDSDDVVGGLNPQPLPPIIIDRD